MLDHIVHVNDEFHFHIILLLIELWTYTSVFGNDGRTKNKLSTPKNLICQALIISKKTTNESNLCYMPLPQNIICK